MLAVNPENKKANITIIHKLYQDGLLKDDTFVAAKKVLRPFSSWHSRVNRILLFLGSTLLLAGIIFFFAYNWNEMGKFLKFGLLESCIITCIIASYLRGMDQLSGKTLLLSACVLTGVLLAVYGQIYQTGADAYELFQGWTFLILGWVIISKFAALWFLWLVILNTAIILFWQQVGKPAYDIRYEWLFLAIAFIEGLALVLREIGVKKNREWLEGKWLQVILLTALLAALSVPAINLIVGYGRTNPITTCAFIIWLLVAIGGYLCYRYKLRDMIPLAIIVMNGCVILLTFIGKILFHNSHGDAGIALLFAFIILGVASGAAFWLKNTNEAMRIEISGENT
ncbi:MAG: DUF2157 domain-containing protein [bacterium]